MTEGKGKHTETEEVGNGMPMFETLSGVDERTRELIESMCERTVSGEDLLNSDLPEMQYWIDRLIPDNPGVILLAGPHRHGKSFFLLQAALCLVSGNEFLGFEVERRGRALYFCAEEPQQELKSRLSKQILGMKEEGLEMSGEHLRDIFFNESLRGIPLLGKGNAQLLEGIIRKCQPNLVIVDPIGRFLGYADINRFQVVMGIMNTLEGIAQRTNSTIMVSHHYGKPSKEENRSAQYRPIGSTAWVAASQAFIGIERAYEKESKNFLTVSFELKFEESPKDMYIERDPESLLYRVTTKEAALRGGVTVENLVEFINSKIPGKKGSSTDIAKTAASHFGVSKGRIRQLLSRAHEEGKLGKKGRGIYYVL